MELRLKRVVQSGELRANVKTSPLPVGLCRELCGQRCVLVERDVLDAELSVLRLGVDGQSSVVGLGDGNGAADWQGWVVISATLRVCYVRSVVIEGIVLHASVDVSDAEQNTDLLVAEFSLQCDLVRAGEIADRPGASRLEVPKEVWLVLCSVCLPLYCLLLVGELLLKA